MSEPQFKLLCYFWLVAFCHALCLATSRVCACGLPTRFTPVIAHLCPSVTVVTCAPLVRYTHIHTHMSEDRRELRHKRNQRRQRLRPTLPTHTFVARQYSESTHRRTSARARAPSDTSGARSGWPMDQRGYTSLCVYAFYCKFHCIYVCI